MAMLPSAVTLGLLVRVASIQTGREPRVQHTTGRFDGSPDADLLLWAGKTRSRDGLLISITDRPSRRP